MSLPRLAIPGQSLGPSSKYSPGPGTHQHAGQIIASIAGPVVAIPPPTPTPTPTTKSNPKSTAPPRQRPAKVALSISYTTTDSKMPALGPKRPLLPHLHSPVLARVTRLTPRAASLAILAVAPAPTPDSANDIVPPSAWTPTPPHAEPLGQLRPQDVRATEKDSVVLREMLRVGDVVRGVVVGVGDGTGGYFVSTAGNANGVVLAWAEGSGGAMVPVSWREFAEVDAEGKETGVRETRKVARPLGMGLG